jgi:hypothetical protein
MMIAAAMTMSFTKVPDTAVAGVWSDVAAVPDMVPYKRSGFPEPARA